MLQVEQVTRRFGQVEANAEIDLEVRPGEVVALLGENGAGKSTLLAILSGYLQPDAGSILMEGAQLRLRSPADAIRAGIGLVHQHLSLVPTFTVREQLRLCGWTSDPLPEMIQSLPLDAYISSLSMGERQRLEVAKCLLAHPRVLLLDEPTTILAPTEVDDLLGMLDQLRDSGLGIVLVTHKMRESLAIADRIVVLRKGRVTGVLARRDDGSWPSDIESVVLRLMFDLDVDQHLNVSPVRTPFPASGPDPELMLEISGLSVFADGAPRIWGLDLDLYAGEIVSVIGVDGQGQRELARAIGGYQASAGEITLQGRSIGGLSAFERAQAGIETLTDDRLGEGAIGSFSLTENMALPRPRPQAESAHGWMNWPAVRQRTLAVIDRWQVVPADSDRPFGTLSGGNMQKLLAGRSLDRGPHVLIALNPMQGLDWQTSKRLWQEFRRHCDGGGTVLVFTGDMEDALQHSDRVTVISDGRLGPVLPVDSVSNETLASQMVGEW